MTASEHRARLVLLATCVVLIGALLVMKGGAPGADRTTTSRPQQGVTSSTRPATSSSASTTRAVVTSTTVPRTTTPSPSTTSSHGAEAVAIRRVGTTRPVVALTFDAGSDVGSAAAILDTLRSNGVAATFGMTGRWAEAHPELVRRMVDEGHQLVNHSYDHPSFTGRSTGSAPLSTAQRIDQLARAEQAVGAAAGVDMAPWFRPPYGDEDASVRRDVAAAGYRYELLWTVDSLGWKGRPASEVIDRCLGGAGPGAIYLFHVGAASTDHLALQPIIDGLRARGFGFATAAGLLGLAGS